MQEAVERRCGERLYWNHMNAGSCWEAQVGGTLGGHGGTRFRTKWMQEVAEGHRDYWSKMNAGSCWGAPGRKLRFDIKTKWTQEVVGRLRGKNRYWNPMNAGSLGSLMRGTGGKLDIETRWAREVVERQGGKPRHWNQVEMHAKSCEEARGEVLRPSEWMQEIAERHKGGKFRYWNQMNAPKWGTSTQVDTKLSPCVTERPEEVWRVEIEKKRTEWEGGGKPNVSQGEGRCTPWRA